MSYSSSTIGTMFGSATLQRLAAGFAASSVPILVLGPAAIGVTFALSVSILLATVPLRSWLPHTADAAKSLPGVALAVVFVSWLPSLILTPDMALTLEGFASTFALVIAGTALWALLVRVECCHELMRTVFIMTALTSVILALSAFLVATEILSFIRFQGWIPSVPGDRLKAFANAAALMVPGVLWAAWRQRGGICLAALTYVAATVVLIGLAKTHAPMAALLGAGAYAAITLVFRLRRRSAVILTAFAITIFVAAALCVLWVTEPPASAATAAATYLPSWLVDPHRQAIWSFTLNTALAEPLLGVGINTVNMVEGAKLHVAGLSKQALYLPSHPHNWLLEIFAETGVAGTLPLLGFVGLLLTGLARRALLSGNSVYLAAGATSAGFWAAGLFNFSFWSAWWQLAHVILLAMILSQRGKGLESTGRSRSSG